MVKICSLEYPEKNEQINKEYFDKYVYALHDFQKWSIDATINGHHVLACAPTGSGKSLCAEFAIDFFWKKGKKSIYCSPIKSLSNQKYYDFLRKFPSISIGLVTGDIKINVTADVLIMTTEILLSTVLNSTASSSLVDLGCVIFDEIHMIGDKERGHVWENSILQMPDHVQIIGLSATLDNPERFALWIETKGQQTASFSSTSSFSSTTSFSSTSSFSSTTSFSSTSSFPVPLKQVYLTKKLVRPVPLTHYSFITVNSGIFKAIKDKSVHQEINALIDKPFVIQDDKGTFNEQTFLNMNKMLTLFDKNEVRVRRGHVLNQVSKFLVENEMLPALCFVFSITKLEKCAEELNYPLLEFDSKVPYTIAYECEQILRKLPNYKEYLVLPEYIKLVALLQKGIGIHHSKMIPVLREIVELLFARGLIKMLFCTTSVAIGLNLPVKTSIFTDIYKHNGEHVCILEGHEYVQAAGRAGRLGIDVVGNVIHLNNLFPRVDITSYKKMLKGAPQMLVSNFKVSYNLLLNSIDKKLEETALAKRSMIQYKIDGQLAQIKGDIDRVSQDISQIQGSLRKVPDNVLEEYVSLKIKVLTLVNKKRKDAERALSKLEDEYKTIVKDAESFKRLSDKNRELLTLTRESQNVEQYLDTSVSCVLKMLETDGFITLENETVKYQLLLKGRAAAHFREVPCLLFTNLVLNDRFRLFSTVELVGFLSCFTNIKVSYETKCLIPVSENKKVKQLIQETYESTLILSDWEIKNGCDTGTDYSMIFDITDYIMLWSRSESEQECRLLLLEMSAEKDIFLGEFVKAILKIVAIAAELAAVAELVGDMELLEKCRQVPLSLQKFVATNQSLYV
jgi:superfamily II RNA helicase